MRNHTGEKLVSSLCGQSAYVCIVYCKLFEVQTFDPPWMKTVP